MKKGFFGFLAMVFLFSCATKDASIYRSEVRRPGVVLSTNDPDALREVASHQNNFATLPPSVEEALKKNPHAYVRVDADGVTYYGESVGTGTMQGIWENYTNEFIEVTIFEKGKKSSVAEFMVAPKRFTRVALRPGDYESKVVSAAGNIASEFTISPIKGQAYSSLAVEWVDFTQYNRQK